MSTITMDDLRKDLEEMEKFMGEAARQKVKSVLTVEVHKLRTEISRRLEEKKSTETSEANGDVTEKTPTPKISKYATNITSYAWDQSDKFFKIYVTLKDVQKCANGDVTSEFTDSSFKVMVSDVSGKDYVCQVAHLYAGIVPDKCYHKVKTDMVLVMLKKKEEKTWAYVTQKEAKAKERKPPAPAAGDKDPQSGMMDLMKQMYDDGDDEMKRTIAKSMYESQNKKSTMDMPTDFQ